MKLLAGQEEELSRLIPFLLGCPTEDVSDGNFIEIKTAKKMRRLVEENAFSHLMEVRNKIHFTSCRIDALIFRVPDIILHSRFASLLHRGMY